MKQYLTRYFVEIFLFIFTFTLYAYTAEPTVSFWDCGEFIAGAYRLQIPHPPGAPLFLLLGRFFSFLSLGYKEYVAYSITLSSALYSSLTLLFLFWTLQQILPKQPKNQYISLIGTLIFAFTDSFWFNATETEVYALSTLLTAISFWAMLKWYHEESPTADKWLLVIAYLIGLAIGVHLLNLLVIPALSTLFYLKKFPNSKWYGILLSFLLGCSILVFVQFVIIQYLPYASLKLDIYLVNHYHFPFFSGLWVVIGILLIISIVILTLSHLYSWRYVQISGLAFILILIGYSVYALVVIRSIKNPNIDEGNPENLATLIYYLKREQYGSEPLLWADSYDSRGNKEKDIDISYQKADSIYYPDYKKKKYVPVDINYAKKYSKPVFFPRRHSDDPLHWITYAQFTDRWTFFLGYQAGWMYFRYLLFNFMGKSSDIQNDYWESGIFDTKTVAEFPNTKGKNHYFGIPLLLGLIGLGMTFFRPSYRAYKYPLLILFFMTGLAIVIYLNQTPNQARERDYSYVGSFYVFSIWISIGIYELITLVQNRFKFFMWTIGIFACFILFQQNFDDHNRRKRYFALDIAKNILNSCEKNAILFTDGDNDTFTLWYAQEVEKIRTDVRVVNITLLGIDHYIWQLKHLKHNDADSLIIPVPDEKYQSENMSFNYLKNEPVYLTHHQDTITWHLPIKEAKKGEFGYLYKSEYFVYQIIKHNFAQRPIYFSATIGFEKNYHFFNLEPYLKLEGMAYRLTFSKPTQSIATAEVSKLKKFIDHTFMYSGFSEKNVWIDELAIAHADYYRNMYLSLLKSLVVHQDTLTAKKYFSQMQTRFNPDYIPFNPILQAKFLSIHEDKNLENHFIKTCSRYFDAGQKNSYLKFQAKEAVFMVYENKVKIKKWDKAKFYAQLYQQLSQEDTLIKHIQAIK